MEMKKSEIFWEKYLPRVAIVGQKTFGSSPKVTVLQEEAHTMLCEYWGCNAVERIEANFHGSS